MKQCHKNVKILMILIDGIGDLSIDELEGKTTLQKAIIPYMDLISYTGLNGMIDPVETGLACGSDTAHMNIFGYQPYKYYKGRGSFEVIGSGLQMEVGEIGFKCNFAYMDHNKIVKQRRVCRQFDLWGLDLIKCLNGNIIPEFPEYKVTAFHATEHRIAIKINGPNLSMDISGTDPIKDNLPLKTSYPRNKDNFKDVLTSKIVNALSDRIAELLADHPVNIERQKNGLLPANIVLLRGCGSRLGLNILLEKDVPYFEIMQQMKAFMIAPTAIINGLGQSIGMTYINVKEATGYYDTDLIAKAKSAIEAIENPLQNYDFGFIHVKAVDDAGHDKNIDMKIKFIEKSDEMIKYLIINLQKNKNELNQEYIICVTGDHTTPIRLGDHSFEPVPFAISTQESIYRHLHNGTQNNFLDKFKDDVKSYDEIACACGALGRFPASEIMPLIKKMRSQLENFYNQQ